MMLPMALRLKAFSRRSNKLIAFDVADGMISIRHVFEYEKL